MRAIVVVLVVLVGVSVVVAASTTLWWLAIATAVAGLLQPAVLFLRRFMPGWVAIIAVIVGVIAVVGLLGYRGFDELHNQFITLQADAIGAAEDLQASKQFGQVATEFGLTEKVTQSFSNLPLQLGGGDTANAVQTAASSGGALFAIAMLALLMLIFGRRMVAAGIRQIADPIIEGRVRLLVVESYRLSSRYVWLMVLRAVIVGILAGVGCGLLGMETPTALGVWFGVLSLIPGLGIAVAVMPVAIYEAIASPPLAVFVFFLAILLQLLDTIFVQRRIEAGSVHVGPGITIVAVLLGADLYGVGGVLVFLAVAVFGIAFLSGLTAGDVDVFTACRALVASREPEAEVLDSLPA